MPAHVSLVLSAYESYVMTNTFAKVCQTKLARLAIRKLPKFVLVQRECRKDWNCSFVWDASRALISRGLRETYGRRKKHSEYDLQHGSEVIVANLGK